MCIRTTYQTNNNVWLSNLFSSSVQKSESERRTYARPLDPLAAWLLSRILRRKSVFFRCSNQPQLAISGEKEGERESSSWTFSSFSSSPLQSAYRSCELEKKKKKKIVSFSRARQISGSGSLTLYAFLSSILFFPEKEKNLGKRKKEGRKRESWSFIINAVFISQPKKKRGNENEKERSDL